VRECEWCYCLYLNIRDDFPNRRSRFPSTSSLFAQTTATGMSTAPHIITCNVDMDSIEVSSNNNDFQSRTRKDYSQHP
jgi:hypothetical protein